MSSAHERQNPVIFVLDHSPVVPKIIHLMLKRQAELSVQVVAFTEPIQAVRWLTGAMDWLKATRYPLPTPWDHYPPLAQTRIGLAILDSEFPAIEGLSIIDWLSSLFPIGTPIVTTSSKLLSKKRRSRVPIVAHLPKPLETHTLIARIAPVITSEVPTQLIPAIPRQKTRSIHRRVHLQPLGMSHV